MLLIFTVFILTGLLGATNGALVKYAVRDISPPTLALLRFLVATLIILPVIYREKFSFGPHKTLLSLASILFAGNIIFFAIGVQYTSVIMSQILYVPSSLIVALVGYMFLREKLTKYQIIGLIFTLGGLSILFYESAVTKDIFSFGSPVGNVLVGTAVICWALFTVFSRKISQTYSPVKITFSNFLITVLVSFLLISLSPQHLTVTKIDQPQVVIILALGVLSVVFFFLYQWLIKNTSAFTSSMIPYLNPIIASGIGVLFFKENLTTGLLFGGVLIILGVFFATSYKYVKIKLTK